MGFAFCTRDVTFLKVIRIMGMKQIIVTLKPIGKHKEEVLTFDVPVDTVEYSDYTADYELVGFKGSMTNVYISYTHWYMRRGKRKGLFGVDYYRTTDKIALIPTKDIKHIITKDSENKSN